MRIQMKLERIFKGDTYTIGKLYIDGEYFCDTLEDKDRDFNKDGDLNDSGEEKVYSQTAIPYGTYQVILNQSPRFKRILPRLVAVPHFTGILIHRGNTHENTSGCILVGENKVKGKVINSTKYEIDLVNILKKADNISISIV